MVCMDALLPLPAPASIRLGLFLSNAGGSLKNDMKSRKNTRLFAVNWKSARDTYCWSVLLPSFRYR